MAAESNPSRSGRYVRQLTGYRAFEPAPLQPQNTALSSSLFFHDVFGLDDEDLEEFGAESDGMFSSTAAVGITAWWQLQHQYGYHPLVTRIILNNTYEVAAQ